MSKNGLILLTPTSVTYSGTSATISANGSVEFLACFSLRLNGVFSADYDNYMVVLRGISNSDIDVRCRLSLSGVDATATNYTKQQLAANGSTVSGSRLTSQDHFDIGVLASANMSASILWFYGPALAQPSAFRYVGASGYLGAYLVDETSTHSVSTAYDGFNFYDNGLNENMTGRVAVYGMRK